MNETATTTTAPRLAVQFVADIVCPWCYIGWRRLQDAVALRPDVTVSYAWLPYQLHPDRPLEGIDRPSMMRRAMPGPGEVEASYAKFKALGAEVGVEMRSSEILIAPNTRVAHRFLLWASAAGLTELAIDRVFATYWSELRDIGKPEVVADIAAEIGMDRAEILARLQGGTDQATVAAIQRQISAAGVNGVPGIIFNNRLVAVGAEPTTVLTHRIDAVLQL